jgi:hypothetical protein
MPSCNRKKSEDNPSRQQNLKDTSVASTQSSFYDHTLPVDSLLQFVDGSHLYLRGLLNVSYDSLFTFQPEPREDVEADSEFQTDIAPSLYDLKCRFRFQSDTLHLVYYTLLPIGPDFGYTEMPFFEEAITSRDGIRTLTRTITARPISVSADTVRNVLNRFYSFKLLWDRKHQTDSSRKSRSPIDSLVNISFSFMTPLFACALTGDTTAVTAFSELPQYSFLDAGYGEEYAEDQLVLSAVLHGHFPGFSRLTKR